MKLEEKATNYETMMHIRKVQEGLTVFVTLLLNRALHHDDSKLQEPELKYFTEFTERLHSLTYGSDEYKKNLEDIEPALKHHYANNRHHPEHWPNGIEDMDLIDLMEMLADWYASSKRQDDGNIRKSLDICAERFKINPQLKKILANTLDLLDK